MTHRSDMTGADRTWAVRYQPGNVVQYTTGSKELGIERGSSATVLSTNARENKVTVQRGDGQAVTYEPTRLRGVNVFQATEREFATGDRLQFTAPDKQFGIVRRDLGTITTLDTNEITVRLDGKEERSVTFDPRKLQTIDHGYAVTSHSAQGLTSGPDYRQHRHRRPARTHQQPSCLRRYLPSFRGRTYLHKRCGQPWDETRHGAQQNLRR